MWRFSTDPDARRCLASRIERDGTRRRTRLFSGFLSHYLIGDRYGRPGKGNDKGAVEGLVGWSRRNFMVPLPRFASLEALNGYLEQRCRERQGDVLRGHRESIAKRLERDLEAMTALPGAPFDACHQTAGQVSSQSLVRYHNNDYSVPVAYGYRQVWVRGYVDRVVIGCGAEVSRLRSSTHGACACSSTRAPFALVHPRRSSIGRRFCESSIIGTSPQSGSFPVRRVRTAEPVDTWASEAS